MASREDYELATAGIYNFIRFSVRVHQEIVNHRNRLLDILSVKEDGFIDKINKLINEIETVKIVLTYSDDTREIQDVEVRVFFGQEMRGMIERSRASTSWRFMIDTYPKIMDVVYSVDKTEFSKILEIKNILEKAPW